MIDKLSLYHLPNREQLSYALSALLKKTIYSLSKKAIILAHDEEIIIELDKKLWTITRDMLPHATMEDIDIKRYPIALTTTMQNLNDASVLFFVSDHLEPVTNVINNIYKMPIIDRIAVLIYKENNTVDNVNRLKEQLAIMMKNHDDLGHCEAVYMLYENNAWHTHEIVKNSTK